MKIKNELKSLVNGNTLYSDELDYDWQNFVVCRQEQSEGKTDESFVEIEGLLSQINDNKLKNNIGDAIINRDCKNTYVFYNRGFLDGLKLAITLEKM